MHIQLGPVRIMDHTTSANSSEIDSTLISIPFKSNFREKMGKKLNSKMPLLTNFSLRLCKYGFELNCKYIQSGDFRHGGE